MFHIPQQQTSSNVWLVRGSRVAREALFRFCITLVYIAVATYLHTYYMGELNDPFAPPNIISWFQNRQ